MDSPTFLKIEDTTGGGCYINLSQVCDIIDTGIITLANGEMIEVAPEKIPLIVERLQVITLQPDMLQAPKPELVTQVPVMSDPDFRPKPIRPGYVRPPIEFGE